MTPQVRPELDEIVAAVDGRPELDQIVAQSDTDPLAKWHRAHATGRLKKNIADKNDAEKVSLLGGFVDAAVEAPATFAAGVPGGKLLMSAGRKLLRPSTTFQQHQRDVNEETSDVPYASAAGRTLGSLATAGIPGLNQLSAAKAGALIGGGEQLLNNDPGSTVGGRLLRTGAGAAGGAIAGKVAEGVSTGVRALRATPLGEKAASLGRTIKKTSKTNYGRAAEEGRAFYEQFRRGADQVDETLARVEGAPKALPAPGQSQAAKRDLAQQRHMNDYTDEPPMTLERAAKDDYTNVVEPGEPFTGPSSHDPSNLQIGDYTRPREVRLRAANDVGVRRHSVEASPSPRVPNDYDAAMSVRRALDRPDVAPYVKEVRGVRKFQNADDATVLRETYKLMSERQGLLRNRMANAGEFKAGTTLEGDELKAAKDALLDAADLIMPSFRGAVKEHARLMGERGAFFEGADATARAMGNKMIAGKKLEAKSPGNFIESLQRMSEPELAEATAGILGRIPERRMTGRLGGLRANIPVPFPSRYLDRAQPLVRAADRAAGNTLPRDAQNAFLALLNELSAGR